jgi:hypothetical protein
MAESLSLQERVRLATEQGHLVELVNEMKAEGIPQREIYDLLENYRYELGQQDRTAEEDYLIDISDRVSGDCRFEDKLFETNLTWP